jgi:DNA-binding response OmpR family regulator
MAAVRLLVVADETSARRALATDLIAAGFNVRSVATGEEAVLLDGGTWAPHAVVIDLSVPDVEALEVCRALRSLFAAPVLCGVDTVRSLAGARENAAERLERPVTAAAVATAVRRLINGRVNVSETLIAGELALAPDAQRATLAGQPLDVSADEFALLTRLVASAGRTVSRRQLCDALPGLGQDCDPRIVDWYLVRLMVKLAGSGSTRIARAADADGYTLVVPSCTPADQRQIAG